MTRAVHALLSARWRGVRNRIAALLSHWPGRVGGLVAVIIILRLIHGLARIPASASGTGNTNIATTVYASATLLIVCGYGTRSVVRPPFVLALGDFGALDAHALIRPALVAGLLARVPMAALVSQLARSVLENLTP